MSEREDLLSSIANTIQDYRAGDLPTPTPNHVDRWVRQFGADVQVPLLTELDHVLKKTYFSRETVRHFFADQINHADLAGTDPSDFWKAAHILDIQQQGHSQSEIRQLFAEALKEQCALNLDDCGSADGAYIYLDDVLFTGSRIRKDLSQWISDAAPAGSTVHILVIATHRLGEWQCNERLEQVAGDAEKEIQFHFWPRYRFENRKRYRNGSEVLWPTELPQDKALLDYVAEEKKFPFNPREPGAKLNQEVFSSEVGRQLLEKELLLAGMRIRSFSVNPSQALRPLGFSPFGLGFGSMLATFRNCPNNAPLALWWGDANAAPDHPLGKWYPLLPRKTYAQADEFDVIF